MQNQDNEHAPEGAREAANPLDMGRLLTAKEVAEYLGLPVLTVYYHSRAGVIPGRVVIGRTVKFDPEALRRWVAKGGQALDGGWRKEPK